MLKSRHWRLGPAQEPIGRRFDSRSGYMPHAGGSPWMCIPTPLQSHLGSFLNPGNATMYYILASQRNDKVTNSVQCLIDSFLV